MTKAMTVRHAFVGLAGVLLALACGGAATPTPPTHISASGVGDRFLLQGEDGWFYWSPVTGQATEPPKAMPPATFKALLAYGDNAFGKASLMKEGTFWHHPDGSLSKGPPPPAMEEYGRVIPGPDGLLLIPISRCVPEPHAPLWFDGERWTAAPALPDLFEDTATSWTPEGLVLAGGSGLCEVPGGGAPDNDPSLHPHLRPHNRLIRWKPGDAAWTAVASPPGKVDIDSPIFVLAQRPAVVGDDDTRLFVYRDGSWETHSLPAGMGSRQVAAGDTLYGLTKGPPPTLTAYQLPD